MSATKLEGTGSALFFTSLGLRVFLLASDGKQAPCQSSYTSATPHREELKKDWMGGGCVDEKHGWIDGWRMDG